MTHTYRQPCEHRRAYASDHGMFSTSPGQPWPGEIYMDDGILMRGPRNEDVEGDFQAWYRARNGGASHADPC